MEAEIYNMDLHSNLTPNTAEHILILRVPGGWIYTIYIENGTGGYDMSSCFVPFNEEFNESTYQRQPPAIEGLTHDR